MCVCISHTDIINNFFIQKYLKDTCLHNQSNLLFSMETKISFYESIKNSVCEPGTIIQFYFIFINKMQKYEKNNNLS